MSPAEGSAPAARSSEIVSLSERTGYLQALRVAFSVVILLSGALAPSVVGKDILTDLTIATGAYLLFSAGAEGLRRLGRGRGLAVVGGMLLVDGVYLAWTMYSTGGTQSPLRFLVFVHLIAVTLLASYRTGLKIALWHSLMYFAVFYAQAAGILEVKETVAGALPGTGTKFQHLSIFNVAAFWLVAIGTAAFSALNERELRRRKTDLEGLARLAEELDAADDAGEMSSLLLAATSEAFGFKRGVVLAAASGEPELTAYIGPGEPGTVGGTADPAIREAWEKRGPVLLKALDPDQNKQLAAVMPFARNVVVLPLIAEGQPLGAVAIETPSPKIERRVILMLTQFTTHAALAMRNAWLLEQVKHLAETDALTGVPNRRTFEAVLARELSRATRSGEPVTLMMIDVDHFKKFNDTYGHQSGDDILKGVAASIRETARDFDTPARYGGEEFAVILPGCTSKESLAVSERIRKEISTIDAPAPVTASAGVATFPTHAVDPESLIKAADEALYESKRAGRDRVTRSRRRAASKPVVSARTTD